MNNIINWVETVLIPLVFDQADKVFPEHHFKKKSDGWHSKTYLDGSPHKSRSDKTKITKKKPNLIFEQGGEALPITKYVMERDAVSYIEAVKHLAYNVGLDLPNNEANVSKGPYKVKIKNNANKANKEKIVYFDNEEFLKTLDESAYRNNKFIQNLKNNFPATLSITDIWKVIKIYKIGTAPQGKVCFPYIDYNGNVRAIQEKLFDSNNKTDKSYKYHTSWTHSRLTYHKYKGQKLPKWLIEYNKQNGIVSCLFGEHLLKKDLTAPIALVEDPKTAIYGSLYFKNRKATKNWLWLGVFNLSSFTLDRLQVLENRIVYVFPDLSKDGSSFRIWKEKADEFEKEINNIKFFFYDFLERYAHYEHKEKGDDLADIIIKYTSKPA